MPGSGERRPCPNELVPGKKTSSSFLHNGTRAMFEKAGFTFERHLGTSKTVMRKTVPAAGGAWPGTRRRSAAAADGDRAGASNAHDPPLRDARAEEGHP